MKRSFLFVILTALLATSLTACNIARESGNRSDEISGNSNNETSENSSNETSKNTSNETNSDTSDVTNISTEQKTAALSDDTISESDVETVKKNYESEDRTVYDTEIIDLDFDGTDELLVLTNVANPKVFEVWEKGGGKLNFECSFGAGKVNYIDEISLEKGNIDGERAYLFTFAYDEGTNMQADEVLSAVRKTSDGYEVEHLLSRGTISYPDIAEPFTKEFFRKGWNKGDIGMDKDFGDISKEEYDKLFKEYKL